MSVKVPIASKEVLKSIARKVNTLFDQPLGDSQFFQKLADEGRLVIVNNQKNNPSTVVEVIPNQGETFYLMSALFNINSANINTIELRNGDTVRETINTLADTVERGNFQLPFDSLIGDGTKSYSIEWTVEGAGSNTVDATLIGYIKPSPTVSSRGTGQ